MSAIAMNYPKYESYKDSGVDWLGEIPSDWDICKLKFLLDEVNIRSTSGNEELLSLSKYQGVIPKNSLDERSGVASTLVGYKKVFKDTLVINKMQATNGLLAISKIEGITSPDYSTYKTKNNEVLDINYLGFLLTLNLYLSEFKKRVTGVMEGFIRLYTDDLYEIHSIIPPINQQKKIVSFLNQKTAQIDQAIALKQQQIDKLNEYKQIVIQNAVTKGLNPNALMKDSGVEWIGEIPQHWEVKKLKYLTSKIGSGITPSGGATTYVDEGIPLLRSQNIHFDGIVLENVANISVNVHKSMKNTQVKKHDVLLNITGGSLGRCCYNELEIEMNVNQHVCIVRPNKLAKGQFINSLLASEIGQKQIWFFQQGGGREGLNFQNLKNFDFPLPSLDEQQDIITYIDQINQKFNKSVKNYQTQIERLKEYKNALINQAVTGKIKVE